METRIALIGIIVEDIESAGKINEILHEYSPYLVGRMGNKTVTINLNKSV